MSTAVLGTAFVSIEARTDKFLASAQKGVSGAVSKLGASVSKPLVEATGKAGVEAGQAFGRGLGNLAVPAALLLAGREITHFVLHGVQDLVTLEKEVERFGTVAGVSAETASRFVGVATDFGVGADQVSLSVGFLGKTLGKNQTALDSFGVAIARNSKGDIDLAKTAFNVIDAYESMDSTTRKAALGVAAFGRGYQALIPLLNVGSSEIQKAFASVSGGELFDQKKQDQVKALGVSMVQIHKSILDLQLGIAQGLAPGIEKLATGMHLAAAGVHAADSATGGAVGTLAKYASGAAAAAVTISLLGKAVGHIGSALSAGTGELTGFGLAARNVAGGLLVVGALVAAGQVINSFERDTGRAKRALDDLVVGLDRARAAAAGGVAPVAASVELLARAGKELEASKGSLDKTADAFKLSGPFNLTVKETAVRLLNFKEALDKALQADPKAGAQIRASLIAAANAADAGDVAERKYLDSLGLTDKEIDKLVTKLNLQTIAQAKAAAGTDDGTTALVAQVDNMKRLTSAVPFNVVVRQNLLDLQTKQTESDRLLADSTQKLIDRYKAEQDALHTLKQAKIDLTDLTLAEEQAHFDAATAVTAYKKALNGEPGSIQDVADAMQSLTDATKNAADAQKTLSDARVAFQRLLLEHPAVITPMFVLQKQAAEDAIAAAQAGLDQANAAVDKANAHVDEVRKGKVSTPEEIKAAFLNAERAINAEAAAASAAKEGLLKSLGKPFTLDDETSALIANLQAQEKAFGKNSPLGQAIQEHIDQLKAVATAQAAVGLSVMPFASGDVAGSRFAPHVSGGPFKKGQGIKVGEDGWELLVPNFDGTVLTHEQSVAAMVGAQMATRARVVSAPPVAPVVNTRPLTGDVYITESPNGRQTYSEFVRALRSRQFLVGAN